MNHLLLRLAAVHCLCESPTPGRAAATPPFLCCYLCPAAVPGQHSGCPASLRAKTGFPATTSLRVEGAVAFEFSGSPAPAEGLSVKEGSQTVKNLASMGLAQTEKGGLEINAWYCYVI